MKWLARLKTGKPLNEHASKPRKPGSLGSLASLNRGDGGFLGSLASLDGGFRVLPLAVDQAANDQTSDPVGIIVAGDDTPTRSVPRGRARSDSPHASQARAQGGAVAPGGDLIEASAPMSTAEVDLFMARVERFTSRGLPGRGLPGRAESLADRLLVRDREGDDRRMCIECRHCTSGRSCGRARAAGLSHQELGELAVMLQRCPTFAPAISTEGARP